MSLLLLFVHRRAWGLHGQFIILGVLVQRLVQVIHLLQSFILFAKALGQRVVERGSLQMDGLVVKNFGDLLLASEHSRIASFFEQQLVQ